MSSRNSLNTRGILVTIHFFQFIQGLLYLFTPKRGRGEREEGAISSPFIGKEFRDIALLKFSLSKLLITGFLISTNSAGNKHLFIENRQQRILHLFNDLSPEVARDPLETKSLSILGPPPWNNNRRSGNVRSLESGNLLNEESSLLGRSLSTLGYPISARPSCIYSPERWDSWPKAPRVARLARERERENRNKSGGRRMDTRERNNPIRRACGSRSRVRKRSRIEDERVAGASVSRMRPALGRDP